MLRFKRKHTLAQVVTFGLETTGKLHWKKHCFLIKMDFLNLMFIEAAHILENLNFLYQEYIMSTMLLHVLQYVLVMELLNKLLKLHFLKFTGANRRFEYIGSYSNMDVYDDYAHHPSEIMATAKAMKNKAYRQSWVIFQPHTYSRTKELLSDFAEALLEFDNIIVTDIYAAKKATLMEFHQKI